MFIYLLYIKRTAFQSLFYDILFWGPIGEPNGTDGCHFFLIIDVQFFILFKTIKQKKLLLHIGVYEAEKQWSGSQYNAYALRGSVRCRIRVWSLAESLYDHTLKKILYDYLFNFKSELSVSSLQLAHENFACAKIQDNQIINITNMIKVTYLNIWNPHLI